MNFDSTFQILAVGLDNFLVEQFKKIIKKSSLKVEVSFIEELDVSSWEGRPDLLVYFSQNNAGKNIKWIRELLFYFPTLQVVMILPKPDYSAVISYFRAGILDVWGYPFEENEIIKTLQRSKHKEDQLKDHPLKTALHFFSQPQMFETPNEIGESFIRFLNIFAKDVICHELESPERVLRQIAREKIKLFNRGLLDSFFNSTGGLIFGLSNKNDQSKFLVKLNSNLYYYVDVKFEGSSSLKKVLTPYILHLLKSVRDFLVNQDEQKELQRLVLTDEITGLYNQRKLAIDLESSVRNSQKLEQAFSLLFIDIDYFKNVNDQYGHVTGSQLLIDMAEVLRTELRGSDAIYRFGGDEFIVLLPKTKLEEAKKIALRLSESVKGQEFTIAAGKTYRLSLSIGLAEFPTDASDSKAIIDFADKMMYMSKKSGRGKVFHVTEVL